MSDISAPVSALHRPGKGVNRSFPTFRAVMALVLREMATRYGRSPGGYLWAIVEPLGMILVLAAAFYLLVRVPPLGNNFILFFATGLLPFQLYMNLSNNVARAMNFSRALLFYPAVTWLDAVLARVILTVLTDVLVMLILFILFVAATDVTLFLDIQPIITAIGLATVLGVGVGLCNCVMFGFFPIWLNVWGIANRPMIFISGILFLYEHMPESIQVYLWYNPVIHVTGLMRAGFYPTYEADYASPLYVLSVSGVLIFLGVLLMGRFHREILNR
ncbi:ABC transporter permease [uncultured Tateyamaria sp.]|uniref:ABC transporter permease n=1 Tax=Tateyamaria sp. 1078 TaxID=3417464 RepID=UPI00261EB9EE|nr:ABC transporter permease [uncultured Tateyamaria sp.]